MTPRNLLFLASLAACGTLGAPNVGEPNTASEIEPLTAATFWSQFTQNVEAAKVVRVYYASYGDSQFPFYYMLTVNRDSRAAIDQQGDPCRDLLIGGTLRTACSGSYAPRLGGDLELSDWAAAITTGLDHLSLVPVTLSGPETPSTHGDDFPDLGSAWQYRLDLGDGSHLNLGFNADATPRRARFDFADGSRREFQLKHIVFDPVLAPDFFEPDGTVHTNGSETLFRGPQP